MTDVHRVTNARRRRIARFGAVLSAVAIVGGPAAGLAAAQDEDALKAFFEGKRVVTRIDLPGTQEGVDVRIDARQPIDYREYGDRLKTFGIAIGAGDSAIVTLLKVKKDLIELQLGGGGYGTFGDDTSTSVYIPFVEKTEREKDLERLVREERDDRRRRDLERELDEIRDRRERENRRIAFQRERASEIKSEEIAERRLRGGSRFNLRYASHVPRDTTPDDVMAALAEFVDFSSLGGPPVAAPPIHPMTTTFDTSGVSDAELRKGMLREDAERRLGPAQEISDHREGDVTVTTLVFLRGDQRISADFIEDVLVRYTIRSR